LMMNEIHKQYIYAIEGSCNNLLELCCFHNQIILGMQIVLALSIIYNL
jgi:hypothetical protein